MSQSDTAKVAHSPTWLQSSLLHRLILSALLIGCLAIRLWHAGLKPFWFDEAFSVEIARIDWHNFLHLLWWREANMSLYYILLRIWLHLGQSPFLIRSLSVFLSAATLPLVYFLGRQLYDQRVGFIAATLFTFHAYAVRYAQEARSYSLFVMLAAASSCFLLEWMQRPTRRNRIAYVAVSILAVYAHFYALLLIFAHWLAIRVRGGLVEPARRELRQAWISIGIGVLPLLTFVAKTGAGPIKWIHRPSLHDLLTFSEQLTGSNMWPLLMMYAAACIFAIAPIATTLLRRDRDEETWRCQFLLIWLLFPIVLTVVLSFARPVFLPRYMIFTLPALIVLAAAGIARLRSSWLVAAALIVVLIPAWRGISFAYARDFEEERDASGAATDFILDRAQAGDAIVFHIAETRIPYEFFRSLRAGENTASSQFTDLLGPEILFPHHGAGLDYRDFTGKPTPVFLRTATAGHRRIWVMLMNNVRDGSPDPTTIMLMKILPESFPQMQCWQFAKVDLRLYSKE